VAFSTYLKHERVPTIAEFQDALECMYAEVIILIHEIHIYAFVTVKVDIRNELLGLHIPYEDVLQSFISVANELVRSPLMVVNSVPLYYVQVV
jgi:hypothetical protein